MRVSLRAAAGSLARSGWMEKTRRSGGFSVGRKGGTGGGCRINRNGPMATAIRPSAFRHMVWLWKA